MSEDLKKPGKYKQSPAPDLRTEVMQRSSGKGTMPRLANAVLLWT